MKKLLFIITVFMMSVSSYSQKIISDEVGSDGIRLIVGELVTVRSFTDQTVFNTGISATQLEDVNKIYFDIKAVSLAPYTVNKGMLLLIKTTDGSVITLKADDNYLDAMVRNIHYIGNTVMSEYSTICSYEITEQDLLKMVAGVTKIRMEIEGGSFEKEFKKDKIGEMVKAEYPEIKKRLQQKKNFSDGF